MEELDEFGIPIKKQPTKTVDEFGIPIKKKENSSSISNGPKLESVQTVGSSGGVNPAFKSSIPSPIPDFNSVWKEKKSVEKPKTFRLPNESDEVEMQRRGITPPPSEILKQTANNTKDLYDLDANGNVIPEKPNKLFAGLKKQDKTKGFYQQGEELVKQNKDIQNGFSEKTTFELEGGKLIPKTTVKDFKTSEGIDKEIENNDLNLDHPYLYYSTFDKENQPKDTFVESNFGENKLADLGVNPADFDGFLNKIKTIGGTSYKAEYLDKEAKGLFEGKGTDLTGGYNIQLAKEIQKQRLLNLYMQDINSRDFAKRKLNQEKVNLGKLGADREQLNTQYTLFDSNKVGAFYEKEMPILTQKLKERDAENKKIYDTHKNGDAGFFYGTKQVLNSGWNGFLDRVNQTSSTMLDKIGLDSGADELRLLNEERQVQRPNTRDVGYASGRTTTYDGVDYLVTNDGQIIDKDKKIRVTDLFFKPTYDAIVNKSKSGEEDSVFSFQGSAIQAGGVLGDMIVQVALQRGVGLASGATVKSGSLLSKIPISKSIGSAIIAQSALGYSQGLEQTYKAAIDAGIDEKMAKVLATDAAQRMAVLYAVTAPISPQTKAIEGIFGSEGKELIKKAIATYTQTGKKGFIETFKQGGKQLSKNAIIFTEEGGKEVFQENIQQGGENYGVNASINRDAGIELLKETISGDEFVNTSILSFGSGGLMTLPGMFSSADKLKTLQQLSQDPIAFEKNLKELVSKGVFANDKADILRKDVKIYSNQVHKIPKNLNKDIAMDVMTDLQEIQDLEAKKKTLDKSFHEDIDAEIETKRTLIKDRIKFDALSKKEITELKSTAKKELIQEAKDKDEDVSKIDNAQIVERANKIYSKQLKDAEAKTPTPEAQPQTEVPQQAEAEKVEIKNEGKSDAPTKENIDERLRINHPFYEKVSDALDKLGLISKYNPETKEGDVVGGYTQPTSNGGFSVGGFIFSKDGSVSFIKDGARVEFDKNGNVISENTKEVAQEKNKIEIKGTKESITNLEKTRDSESFKYKEVTEIDILGNRKKVKRLKTTEELKESTDKINAAIDKAKSMLTELEKNQPQEVSPVEDVVAPKQPDNVIKVEPAQKVEIIDESLPKTDNSTDGKIPSLEEAEYKEFVNNNIVSNERLVDIADKVKKAEKLTPYENSIFHGKTSDINKIIADEKLSPTNTPTDGNQIKDTKPIKSLFTGRKSKVTNFNETKGEFIFFSENENVAEKYGEVTNATVDTENFLDLSSQEKKSELINSMTDDEIIKIFKIKESDRSRFPKPISEEIIKFKESVKNGDQRFSGQGDLQNSLLRYLKSKGYDGVVLQDAQYGKLDNSYVVFNKNIINKNEATPKNDIIADGDVQPTASNVGESRVTEPKSTSKSSVPSSVDGGEVKGDIEVVKERINPKKEADKADKEEEKETAEKPKETQEGQKKQAFTTNSFNSENLNPEVKKKLKALGLNYDVENQSIAQKNAEQIIAELGIVDAYILAKGGQIRGGARTWIMAQMFEDLNNQINEASEKGDTDLVEYLSTELSNIIKTFANEKTLTGQETAMLNRIYNKFGIKYDLEFARENWKKRFGNEIPVEVEAKLKKAEAEIKEYEKKVKELEERIGTLEEQDAMDNLKDVVELNAKNDNGTNQKTYTQEELENEIAEAKKDFESSNIGFEIKPSKTKLKQEEVLLKIQQIKDKWKSAGNDNQLMASLPYAKQLAKVTPDIIELAKLYSQIGGLKTIDIFNNIKEAFDWIKDNDLKTILKKEFGNKKRVMSPETKRKIYISLLNKRINYLDEQIEKGKKEVKSRTDAYATDEEINNLREIKNAKEEELSKIDSKFSERRKLEVALNNAQKSLDEYQRKIDELDFETKAKQEKFIDVNLRNLRNKRDAKKKEFDSAKRAYDKSIISEDEVLAKQINSREKQLEKRLEDVKSGKQNTTSNNALWSPKISELESELKELRDAKKKVKSTKTIKLKEVEQGAIKIPSDLIYSLVQSGIDNISDLTQAVHDVISKEYPNLTLREVRDAITGYGKQIEETEDTIKKEINRLKTDGKQMSALDDLAEGNRPKRSGRKAKEYTPEQRNRIKKIRELLKNLPIDDTADTAKFYKNAIENYKTRLENRIKDLNEALAKNERIVNERKNTVLDNDAKELVKKRDEAQKEYDERFGKPYKSDETLINEIVKRKEKSLRDLELQLESVKLEGKELTPKERRTVIAPKIDALNKKIDEKREELNDALEEVGIAESKRLERAKKYSSRRLKDLNEKLANGDFTKRKPKTYKYDKELIDLKRKIITAKTKWDIEFEKQEFKKLGYAEKLLEYVYKAFGTVKGLKATADFSAMLRQGVVLGSRNPKEYAKASVDMHKFAFDSKAYKDWMTELELSDDYINMVEDGLSITDTSGDVLKSEEQFVGNLLSKEIKVNGVDVNLLGRVTQGSERAYGGFLNSLRVSVYRKTAKQHELLGYNRQDHPKVFKNIAKFVNNATGRGVMTTDKRVAKALNILFFSPRMITGMVGTIKDMVRSDSTPYLRKQAATSLITFMGYQYAMKMLIGSALGLIGGDDDEEVTMDMNPVSTDFNKVRKGNKRYDVSSGYGIGVRTAARFILNKTSKGIGEENQSFDDMYEKNRYSEIGSFLTNKLSPLSSQIYKYGIGDHPTEFGKKKADATTLDYVGALVAPISMVDFIENIQEGTPEGQIFLDLLLNTYGVGVQSYEESSTENNSKGRSSRSGGRNR